MVRIESTPAGHGSWRDSWLLRRAADALVFAAGLALALPLIVPFA